MKPAGNKTPKNEPGSPSAGEMQLYRLSGTLNKVNTTISITMNHVLTFFVCAFRTDIQRRAFPISKWRMPTGYQQTCCITSTHVISILIATKSHHCHLGSIIWIHLYRHDLRELCVVWLAPQLVDRVPSVRCKAIAPADRGITISTCNNRIRMALRRRSRSARLYRYCLSAQSRKLPN